MLTSFKLLFAILLLIVLNVKAQVTDQDRQTYMTVKIGNQEWMAENLNVSHFRNGDPIPEAKSEEEWEIAGEEGKPAWCYYGNSMENGQKYGKLYNWYTVNDPRGLAPKGWHVPSQEEWSKLVVILAGEATQPGGLRTSNNSFEKVDSCGYWWCTNELTNVIGIYRIMFYENGQKGIGFISKRSGLSVRCLKD